MTTFARGTIFALLTIVFLQTAAVGQSRAGLEGVAKHGSQPIGGALAVANDYGSVWHVLTDGKGQFSFSVPAGCYDVLISSALYHPEVKRVCVREGEVKKLSFTLKRETNPKLSLE